LRRPKSDSLRDGIHELRARKGRAHYRILYGFYDKHAAVLCHGITKEDRVDSKDIDLAVRRLALVKENARRYTAEFKIEE
jgi:phage-related protein